MKGKYFIVSKEHLGEWGYQDGDEDPKRAARDYLEALQTGEEVVILYAVIARVGNITLEDVVLEVTD